MDNKELKRAVRDIPAPERKSRCARSGMSRHADRQRNYRKRQTAGKICLQIEVDEVETVQALIAAGFLAADAAENRALIAAAIERLVALLVARDA